MSAEIYFDFDGTHVQTRTPWTPGVKEAIEFAGYNPRDFNRMRWPLGGSQHATCRLLLDKTDMDDLRDLTPQEVGGGSPSHSSRRVTLYFGNVKFDAMHLHYARPILCSEGSGVMYAVDLVDERYFWKFIQNHGLDDDTTRSINVTHRDKTVRYDITENSGSAYTALEALKKVFTMLDTAQSSDLTNYWVTSEFDISDSSPVTRLSESDGLADLMWSGFQGMGKRCDWICQAFGYVLLAYPSAQSGTRYKTAALETGDEAIRQILLDREADVIGGGLFSYQGEDIGGVLNDLLVGNTLDIGTHIPDLIQVQFPAAPANPEVIAFNEADATEAPFGNGSYLSSFSTTSNTSISRSRRLLPNYNLADMFWAYDGVSSSDRNDRRDAAASAFFARYNAGIGDLLFRGFQDFLPYSGAGVIEYALSPHGPTTRISGDFFDPIYGWRTDQPLSPEDVIHNGGVRVYCRPFNGILVDTPRLATVYHAEVDAVNGSSPNFTYDATAVNDSEVTVSSKAPLRGTVTVSGMTRTVTSASVGDACLIIIPSTSDGSVQLVTPTEDQGFA